MRGLKVNQDSRKMDIVLVAVRYADDGVLEFAKGYERRGVVWSDVRLFDREALLNLIRSGARIVTGKPVMIPGNYDPQGTVRVVTQNGRERIVADGRQSSSDDLGLPIL